MCMADYSDPVTILHAEKRKARKAHKCTECRREIAAGETYINESCLFDGAISTYKTCAHCQVVRNWLGAECGGWLYQGVEEDICEHAREGYGFGFKLLAVGMARNWKRKDGRMWPIPKMPKLTPVPF